MKGQHVTRFLQKAEPSAMQFERQLSKRWLEQQCGCGYSENFNFCLKIIDLVRPSTRRQYTQAFERAGRKVSASRTVNRPS